MKRRAILLAGGAWMVSVGTGLLAQPSRPSRTIAVLIPGRAPAYRTRLDAFRHELARLGHVEGRDVSLETRWAEDRTETLGSLARELVALQPAAILTATSAGVAACKAATSKIPIVFATAGSPVEQGFVASLRRPGGNVTGVVVYLDLGAKIVEAAREAVPRAHKLAILVHDSDPIHKLALDVFLPAAQRLKFEPVIVRVKSRDELASAFGEIAAKKAEVLCLPQQAFSVSNGRRLAELAREARLPLFSAYEEITVAGGLLSYGHSREESFRRAALLVDKILRGANPAELPVEQPERVELVLNLKTARNIGVKIPEAMLQRADRVIQ